MRQVAECLVLWGMLTGIDLGARAEANGDMVELHVDVSLPTERARRLLLVLPQCPESPLDAIRAALATVAGADSPPESSSRLSQPTTRGW